jgi:predicted O-methyltransferase YrrM
VPSITDALARPLRETLGLRRAVETGTFMGDGAKVLAAHFPEVVTVERSPQFHEEATRRLRGEPTITVLLGHSTEHLPQLVAQRAPTFWFLDSHWSGGESAGEDDECPVLREIAMLAGGHPDDVVVVDDARYFAAAPPPPHDPDHWPTLVAVIDALRERAPRHVTVLDDRVIAVPPRAKPVVDEYGREIAEEITRRHQPAPGVVARARAVLSR